MTIATGSKATASDVLTIAAAASSAATAAGVATANASTALTTATQALLIANAARTAAAGALSVAGLPLLTSIGSTDLVAIGHAGTSYAVPFNIFTSGLNTGIVNAISAAAVALSTATSAAASATAAVTAAGSAVATANAALAVSGIGLVIANLPAVTSAGTADLVPISRNGTNVAVTTNNLLAPETIDQLAASGAAADTDTFLTGQNTNVMTRQTLGALWTWLQTQHLPGYHLPVQEITANLTVDGTYCGKILVVTAAGVVISPNYSLMGAGFACEIVTSGSGTVTWGAAVTSTNGASGLPANSYARLIAFTSNGGGNVVLASVGSPAAGGATAPGTISGLTLGGVTSTSLAYSWTAPSSGGAATYYAAQYRVTGTGTWTPAPNTGGTSTTITGLSSGTQYDVQVAAGNAGGLSPYSATVTGTTAAPSIAAPGTPTGLAVGSVTSSTIPLTWTAPTTGGAAATYTVQYRVTSTGGSWTLLSPVSVAAAMVSGLAAATQYDFQVQATNAGGSSAFTATVNGTTGGAPSTTASWGAYPTSIGQGTHALIYNLLITSGTAPATVAIGFSTSQTIAPSPMPAAADGLAGNFNGNYWGTYMNAPASAGTV